MDLSGDKDPILGAFEAHCSRECTLGFSCLSPTVTALLQTFAADDLYSAKLAMSIVIHYSTDVETTMRGDPKCLEFVRRVLDQVSPDGNKTAKTLLTVMNPH